MLKTKLINIFRYVAACCVVAFSFVFASAQDVVLTAEDTPKKDTTSADTSKLRFPIKNQDLTTYEDLNKRSAIDVKGGSDYVSEVEYDPNTGLYIFYRKIGNMQVATPFALNATEYTDYMLQQSMDSYWMQKADENKDDKNKLSLSNIEIGLGTAGDKIFGPGGVKVKMQGTLELKLGMGFMRRESPTISERNRKSVNFDCGAKVQMSVNGSVGDRIKMNFNYNTESTFDADEMLVKLAYEGKEDDIIKKIEVGNVSLPLSSSLIPGSTKLFGIMTQLQYGKLKVSAIVSKQESESKTISTKNGSQTTEYELSALQYDENRHFFLDEYFYNNYDKWMETAPNVKSGIVIKKIEVWVTNTRASTTSNNASTRNILAFRDLAQTRAEDGAYYNSVDSFPYNGREQLYKLLKGNQDLRNPSEYDNAIQSLVAGGGVIGDYQFVSGFDYEPMVNARMLSTSEYTINEDLGYISLRSAINDNEALSVAYEYIKDGRTYKVGELTTDNIHRNVAKDDASRDTVRSSMLYTKLIKATSNNPENPHLWKLMMKNVYNIGGYNIQEDKFKLDIRYSYYGDSISYYRTDLPEPEFENKPLIQTMKMDRLNSKHRASPDGRFDFLEGLTVIAATGRVILPVVEPFGSSLANRFKDTTRAKKYTFPELYTMTKSAAEEYAEKNRFYITGEYKSSSGSEIRLNATQIPKGSVRVTAGGRTLQENVGYTVDYGMGIVRILDEAVLASNQQVNVTLESTSMFSTQQKSLVGTNLEYAFNDHFALGATVMHLSEKPYTDKVLTGNEPISNTIWGVNGSYSTQSNWLTKFTNSIPGINASAPSQFSISGEFAQLCPGHGRGIEDDNGTSMAYLDDFEGAESRISLMTATSWTLASVPQRTNMNSSSKLGGKNFVRKASYESFWSDPLIHSGLERGHFAWYHVDNIFQKNYSNTPKSVTVDMMSNHFVRQVSEKEIYQNRDEYAGEPTTLTTFNIAFYPKERGMYNLDVTNIDPETGLLNDPATRWGGIMRKLEQTDFEKSNIEYLQFWLMDPWAEEELNNSCKNTIPSYGSGVLVFNLGDVSEDVLKDGQLQHEDGLETENNKLRCDSLIWGRVPRKITYSAFDNDELDKQDLGLDGLSDEAEKKYTMSYGSYYNEIAKKFANIESDYINRILDDPAGDNFHHYRGDDYDKAGYDVLRRYKYYNGMQGNSVSVKNESFNSSTSYPNTEDLNGDNNLSQAENYYEYRVKIDTNSFKKENWAENHIVNEVEYECNLRNGKRSKIKWYQFRIPVRDKEAYSVQGKISGFNSIKFMRMYMTNFVDSTFLRFASLEFTKTSWKVYKRDTKLLDEGYKNGTDAIQISAIDIEKDQNKSPIGYCLPPGVKQTQDPSQAQARMENERSMLLSVSNLAPKEVTAVYKSMSFDARQYERFRMYVHAEDVLNAMHPIPDNELYLFIRMGSDFTENYYEYKVPLKITQPGPSPILADVEVWPQENEIDFRFEDFTNLKLRRNKERLRGNAVAKRYSGQVNLGDYNEMIVVGNPSFADVTTVMIGVVNESGNEVSADIWVDEMRMTGFNEDGGWAALARVGFTLSDFASFDATGRIETTGFGGIEANVMERNLEDTYTLDLSTTMQLGKFFPEKARVNMPLSINYSREKSKPKYDPTDTDVLLNDALDIYNDREIRANADSIRREVEAQSLTTSEFTSYALTNVRVGVVSKKKPMPYDPANFSFTVGYNKRTEKDPETEYDVKQNYNGDFNYNYSISPKPVEPFKKVKFLKHNNWKLIRDFNFYYLPTNISLSTSMKRYYNEVKMRNFAMPNLVVDTSFNNLTWDKDWTWDRTADVKWNLTKALKLNFTTSMNSTIDEVIRVYSDAEDDKKSIYKDIPVNRSYLNDVQQWAEQNLADAERKYLFENNEDELWYERWKDTVKSSLRHFGTPYVYNQRLSAKYNVPINKLPYLDWITLDASYGADYNWQRGVSLELNPARAKADGVYNIAMSKRMWDGSTRLNFENLYNKSDYLKSVNKKFNSKKPLSSKKKEEEEKEKAKEKEKPKTYERKNVRLKQGNKTRISHRLGASKVIVTATDKDGKPYAIKHEVIDANAINLVPTEDATGINVVITAKHSKEHPVLDGFVRALMMVRTISGTYRYTDAFTINGYNKGSGFFGMDQARNPGGEFTFGFYNREDYKGSLIDKGYVNQITEGMPATPILETTNLDMQLRSQIEPYPGVKIDLNASWSHSDNRSTYNYKDNVEDNGFVLPNTLEEYRANMSYTTVSIRTAFKGAKVQSELFDDFINNIMYMQDRVCSDAKANGVSEDIFDGGDKNAVVPYTTSDVLVPAFIAAYRGKSLGDVKSPLPDIRSIEDGRGKTSRANPRPAFLSMLPNWKITFDLLNRAQGLKKTFKTFTLSHGYKSTFNINDYQSYSNWTPLTENEKYGMVKVSDNDDEISSAYCATKYAVSSVGFNEMFNPLIGVNASLKNSVRLKLEYKKNRNIALDVPALQIVESYGKEFVIGSGYRIDDFGSILGIGGDGKKQKKVSNDLNLACDISFKNTDAFIRKIEEGLSELNSGLRSFSLSFTAEYVVSSSFNIQFYFDRSASHPKVSSSYPITNTNFGFKFKFQLNN